MAFLRNVWYCAGFVAELSDKPVGRTFLNEEVVLFRGESGRAYALSGRCPHRFAPMSMGKTVGDTIMCGYHGLRFGGDGRCTQNPHGDQIPPLARLRAYPLVEKAGVLWIWMGDPLLADEADLPEWNFMADPNYETFTFYLHVAANYQLVTDNLLDLTHAPYIHAGTLTHGPEEAVMHHDFSVKDNVILSNYHTPSERPSAFFEKLFDEEFGETFVSMMWRPASSLYLDVSMRPIGSNEKGVHTPSLHLLTPETDTTTHYFNAQGRNHKLGDKAATEHAKRLISRAFLEEDAPMIKACQEFIGRSDLFSLRPAILKTDTPAVQARRTLVKMIRREQGRTDSEAEPELAG